MAHGTRWWRVSNKSSVVGHPLSRAHTTGSIWGQNNARKVLDSYDIVALQPTSERTFQQACSVLDGDLITVDLTQRMPFRLRPPLVKVSPATRLPPPHTGPGPQLRSRLRVRVPGCPRVLLIIRVLLVNLQG
jgi:hypothetical protein